MLENLDIGAETLEELAQHPHWQLAQRIAESPALVRSHRLRSFLLYVTRCALLEHADHVTEQQIGVHVFGRPADYNASEDNIVRSHARILRSKLAEYFQSEAGAAEPTLLTIPKGSYLPQFHPREGQAPPAPAPVPSPTPVTAAHRRWLLPAAALLLCAVAGAFLYVRTAAFRPETARAVWNALLESGRPTTIVASDYIYMTVQETSGRVITLDEYLSKDYYRLVEELNAATGLSRLIPHLAHRHYTGFENVTTVKRLTALVPGSPNSLTVRFARDLTMRDIEGANLILIGSRQSNPWVYLFEQRMNFRFVYHPETRDIAVENRAPRAGEEAVYRSHPEGGASRLIYGGLALLPGLQRGNSVLIVQGTAMAGAEAALSVLENPALYQELMNCVGKSASPYFEALIRNRSVSTVSGEISLVGCRQVTP